MSEPKTCDVLISCAKYTYQGFGGNLLRSLKERGFSVKLVSVDHGDLKKEEIECFRIFIIVFSDHYATCSSRLDKLTEIFGKYGAAKDRRIFPVFYDVTPNHVRYQKGSFDIAFDSHKNHVEPGRLEGWRMTLKEVADFTGWTFERSRNTRERQVIANIVQKVSDHVPCTVGLHCRVEKVNDLLKSESDNRVRVLIYGEAGIGKTTVVRGVCRSNAGKFSYYCFLEKVGENFMKHGLIRMLLSKMIGDNDSESGTEEEILRKKGKQKGKSLLVFEDILDEEQLKCIVDVTSDYFSSNSKVIITAEENCSLQCPEIEIYEYEVERLTEAEGIELFSLKAFNSLRVDIMHWKIILQAVTTASGVPFTLELLGSYLREKSADRQIILNQCEKFPNEEKKQKIVQMIVDTLSKDQNDMLIHIADKFNREEKEIDYGKLHCSFDDRAKDDFNVLLDKTLVKIDEKGLVTVHHLIHNMVKDMKYGKQGDQPASNYGSTCDSIELDKNGYVMEETQPSSNDYECECQNCSSSSS